METDKINSNKNEISKKKGILTLSIIFIIVGGLVGYFYWKINSTRIYIEDAQILAPKIALSSASGGVLRELFVKVGDTVSANTKVAQVGYNIITTKVPGIIINVKNNIGENFSPGQAVATMINTSDLQVVASIQENKGLNKIRIGDKAYFTVDAFGSQRFPAIVDEISPTSKTADVVFNISDKRQENYFNVKLNFDENKYPQFRNGMSAKAWVYKTK